MKNYRTRGERAEFLRANFAPFLRGRVLDVGCDMARLRASMCRGDYIGIDMYGDPDVRVHLEEAVLPFGNGSFDTVVCLDVLEHLEHIHQVLSETIRVTRTFAIYSLPNPVGQSWPRLVRGGGGYDKYGLPLEPPQDRHRWFFNYEEARAFLITLAHRNNARVLRVVPVPLVEEAAFLKAWAKKILKRLVAPAGDRHLNLTTQAVWALIEKQG